MDAATIMQRPIRLGVYENDSGRIVVKAVAFHEATGKRIVVFKNSDGETLACEEEGFLAKDLRRLPEKESRSLSWLWNSRR